jgi:hypothetical protein
LPSLEELKKMMKKRPGKSVSGSISEPLAFRILSMTGKKFNRDVRLHAEEHGAEISTMKRENKKY